MSDPSGSRPGGGDSGVAPEDDLQRRFREALDRKRATAGRHRHAEGGGGRGAGPASNEKVRRQFRRKSG